jgi:hypothetical protein
MLFLELQEVRVPVPQTLGQEKGGGGTHRESARRGIWLQEKLDEHGQGKCKKRETKSETRELEAVHGAHN